MINIVHFIILQVHLEVSTENFRISLKKIEVKKTMGRRLFTITGNKNEMRQQHTCHVNQCSLSKIMFTIILETTRGHINKNICEN